MDSTRLARVIAILQQLEVDLMLEELPDPDLLPQLGRSVQRLQRTLRLRSAIEASEARFQETLRMQHAVELLREVAGPTRRSAATEPMVSLVSPLTVAS
jgi:hypothetical protein